MKTIVATTTNVVTAEAATKTNAATAVRRTQKATVAATANVTTDDAVTRANATSRTDAAVQTTCSTMAATSGVPRIFFLGRGLISIQFQFTCL